MTQNELNSMFKKQNLITTLSYTLIGISLVKDRFKEYDKDQGSEGYHLLMGVYDAEQLTKQLLSEIVTL